MKKIIIMILLVCLTGCGANKTTTAITATDVKESVSEENKDFISHIDVDKKETIYATADAYGNIEKSEVEVILLSGKEEKINDISDLTDIRNTHSDEEFVYENGELIFENKGEDIHYKGISNKKLPVDVKITYYLNNKEIDVNELVGKSGRLKIEFVYHNNTSVEIKNKKMIYPFLALNMIMLDQDKFNNISIENGKLLEYGDNQIALLYGLPGIEDALKLSDFELSKDIELPEKASLSCDVNNFSLDYIATILSNELFVDIEDDDLKKAYELSDDLNKFKDSADDLKSNTERLYAACSDLDDGLSAYLKAVSEIDEGMSKIVEGSDKINSSLKQISETFNSFENDEESEKMVNDIIEKIKTIYTLINYNNEIIADLGNFEELKKIIEGSLASEEEKKEMNKLIEEYQESIDKLEIIDLSELEEYIKLLNENIDDLKSLIDLPEGMKELSAGMDSLNTSLAEIKTATSTLSSNNKSISEGLSELVKAAKEFDDGVADFVKDDIDSINKYGSSSLKEIADRIKILRDLDSDYGCFSGLAEGKKGKSVFVIETAEIK